MSLQRVNLTAIVVLGHFVRFTRVGACFETVDKVYNRLFGEIRVCALSYLTSLLVTSVTCSALRRLEPG